MLKNGYFHSAASSTFLTQFQLLFRSFPKLFHKLLMLRNFFQNLAVPKCFSHKVFSAQMLVTKIISLHTFLPKFVRSCLKQNCHFGHRDVFRSAHAPALHAMRAREMLTLLFSLWQATGSSFALTTSFDISTNVPLVFVNLTPTNGDSEEVFWLFDYNIPHSSSCLSTIFQHLFQ